MEQGWIRGAERWWNGTRVDQRNKRGGEVEQGWIRGVREVVEWNKGGSEEQERW